MRKYQAVFSLLFRLNRIESMLNSTWRQSTALTHALHTFAQHNGIGVDNAGYSAALVLLREISITRQSMMHFTRNLKSYFMFEVLEAGWKDLVAQIEAARTIDDIIAAHDNYLEDIFRKSLLAELITADALPAKIEHLLKLSASFCSLQDAYFTDALDASERANERRREAEKRAELGQWGFDSERELHEEETFFGLTDKTKMASVHHISKEFSEQMTELLGRLDQIVSGPKTVAGPETESLMSPAMSLMSDIGPLSKQNQLDHDSLRFLSRQLDYSDFYSTAMP
jgi:gamma-tubulin complex component 3